MRRIFLTSTLALALVCCTKESLTELNIADEPTFQPLPAGAVIRIVRTACYGSCPIYTVLVFETGDVVFEGKQYVKVVGKVSRHIDPSVVRRLRATFESSSFPNLDTYYSGGHLNCLTYATDQSGTITSVRLASSIKTVYYNRGCAARPELDQLSRNEKEVDRETAVAEWVGGAV